MQSPNAISGHSVWEAICRKFSILSYESHSYCCIAVASTYIILTLFRLTRKGFLKRAVDVYNNFYYESQFASFFRIFGTFTVLSRKNHVTFGANSIRFDSINILYGSSLDMFIYKFQSLLNQCVFAVVEACVFEK